MKDYILKPGTYVSKSSLQKDTDVPGLSLEKYIVRVLNGETCCVKPIVLTAATLLVEDPLSTTLQIVKDRYLNTSSLQVGTTKTKVESSQQCPLEVESTVTGGGIALLDNTTTDNQSVGIGALGDDLCLRSGGEAAGNARLLANGTFTFLGNPITNFVPITQSGGAITINSSNQDTYCGNVYNVTGAVTITIADTVRDGFNMSVVQMDANQCTIAATGTLTLRNRQSHTQSAGQWATLSLLKTGNNLVLSGDTA